MLAFLSRSLCVSTAKVLESARERAEHLGPILVSGRVVEVLILLLVCCEEFNWRRPAPDTAAAATTVRHATSSSLRRYRV